jgi:uncharacterized protein YlzI (FlbEa/FlbD family)
MTWVLCTDEGGTKIYVNLSNALRIEPNDDATRITFVNGETTLVKDAPAEIIARIGPRSG